MSISTADELERLATLHQGGALTDEEFAAAKAKALSSDQADALLQPPDEHAASGKPVCQVCAEPVDDSASLAAHVDSTHRATTRPTPDPATPPMRGFWGYLQRVNESLPGDNRYRPGHAWSYDWCRFRHNQRCMFPRQMNIEATRIAGYSVWIPEDRGWCPRHKWTEQEACAVSEPGPNSGENPSYLDATVAWEDGGQHGGVSGPSYHD